MPPHDSSRNNNGLRLVHSADTPEIPSHPNIAEVYRESAGESSRLIDTSKVAPWGVFLHIRLPGEITRHPKLDDAILESIGRVATINNSADELIRTGFGLYGDYLSEASADCRIIVVRLLKLLSLDDRSVEARRIYKRDVELLNQFINPTPLRSVDSPDYTDDDPSA